MNNFFGNQNKKSVIQKSFARIGYSKTLLILDFLKTAAQNGLSSVAVYLPSNHPVIRENGAKQIRTLKGYLAIGYDSLGNRVVLTTQGNVLQLLAGER